MSAGPVTHTHDPTDPNELTSDLGWALYPIGFSSILEEAWTRYGKPIQILENGIADAATRHAAANLFGQPSAGGVVRHQCAGRRYRRLLSLVHLDNFEWAEGFGPRFGLFAVDYNDNFARAPRDSAGIYAEIIRNGISEDLWDAHRGPF